jgi:hypothetical protein
MVSAAVLLSGLPPSVAAEDLRLRMSVEKLSFAPFEPVPVQYELVNATASTQTYHGDVGPNSDWVKFEVGTAGALHPYRTGPIVCRFIQDRSLGPGQALRAQIIMISNQHATARSLGEATMIPFLPFGVPGHYEIHASYPKGSNDPKDVLGSNVLRITIRDASDREREAIAFFASPDALSVALGGETSGTASPPREADAAVASWEQFVEAFGITPYGPYVRLNLARAYLHDERLTLRRPDLAAKHLRSVIASGPRSIADDALLELAKSALAEGRIAEAEAATTKLLRDFPDSEQTPEGRRISEGLKAGRRTLEEILSN